MLRNLIIFALLFSSSHRATGQTLSDVEQIGDTHNAQIQQSNDGNSEIYSRVQQDGSANSALVAQNANSYAAVSSEINQQGEQNIAVITQSATGITVHSPKLNNIFVEQTGLGNLAEASQGESYISTSSIIQIGQHNRATTAQGEGYEILTVQQVGNENEVDVSQRHYDPVAFDYNYDVAEIEQSGEQNSVSLLQENFGSAGAGAHIFQQGADNSAVGRQVDNSNGGLIIETRQSGERNIATTTQEAAFNVTWAVTGQVGDNNTANIYQSGTEWSTAAITQVGDDNVSNVEQRNGMFSGSVLINGDSNSVNLQQNYPDGAEGWASTLLLLRGDSNIADIRQSGFMGANESEIEAIGDYNVLIIKQQSTSTSAPIAFSSAMNDAEVNVQGASNTVTIQQAAHSHDTSGVRNFSSVNVTGTGNAATVSQTSGP